jgi:hypothetical protein
MAKDDYFVIAYKILRTLEAAMRVEEFDAEQISADILHINTAYWENIIVMLFQEGYIAGVTPIPVLGRQSPGIKVGNVRITEKGLVYLRENAMMRKAARFAKGIADILPI